MHKKPGGALVFSPENSIDSEHRTENGTSVRASSCSTDSDEFQVVSGIVEVDLGWSLTSKSLEVVMKIHQLRIALIGMLLVLPLPSKHQLSGGIQT